VADQLWLMTRIREEEVNSDNVNILLGLFPHTYIPYIMDNVNLERVICSRNRIPRPGSKIPYPVPNPGNYYRVFHHHRTKYHQFWPVFASIHDVLLSSHSQTSLFDYSYGFSQ